MLTAKLYCYWLKSKKKLDFFHCTVLHLFAITKKPYDFENKPVYLKIYSDLYSFSKKFQPVEKLEILGALLLVYAYTRELNQALVVLSQDHRNDGFRELPLSIYWSNTTISIKFMHFEKATKFYKIYTVDLTGTT